MNCACGGYAPESAFWKGGWRCGECGRLRGRWDEPSPFAQPTLTGWTVIGEGLVVSAQRGDGRAIHLRYLAAARTLTPIAHAALIAARGGAYRQVVVADPPYSHDHYADALRHAWGSVKSVQWETY